MYTSNTFCFTPNDYWFPIYIPKHLFSTTALTQLTSKRQEAKQALINLAKMLPQLTLPDHIAPPKPIHQVDASPDDTEKPDQSNGEETGEKAEADNAAGAVDSEEQQ